MLEEEVIIILDSIKDKNAAFPIRRAHVKCTFLFHNTSSRLIKATVGFPGNEQDTANTYSKPISGFTATIDGHRYKIGIKKEIIRDYKEDNVQVFRNWYTWKMQFPANGTVKIENSYFHYLSTPSGYDPFVLTYKLSTGANWKGPIGKATIKVFYKNNDDLENRICEIKPNGWVRNQNEITWTFINIKPKKEDNIFLSERNLWEELPKGNRKPLLFKKK